MKTYEQVKKEVEKIWQSGSLDMEDFIKLHLNNDARVITLHPYLTKDNCKHIIDLDN